MPRKFRYCSYRNEYQGRMGLSEIALADGRWFTAPVDARSFRERAMDLFEPEVLEGSLERSLVAGSPLRSPTGRSISSSSFAPRR
ncbi:hypothetical protein ACFQGT_10370 [Natrialbaceae archaeon GCM10025810]|uniref:hypothetical protein n=1 Tax=Halovalidus salilacus TaxID=3075124 RepID=UPI0036246146